MLEYRITLSASDETLPSNFSINSPSWGKRLSCTFHTRGPAKWRGSHMTVFCNASDFSGEGEIINPSNKINSSLSFHDIPPRADPSIRHTTHKHIIICFFRLRLLAVVRACLKRNEKRGEEKSLKNSHSEFVRASKRQHIARGRF